MLEFALYILQKFTHCSEPVSSSVLVPHKKGSRREKTKG